MRLISYLRKFEEVGELTKKYSNLPDSYIKRSMEQIVYRTPRGLPNYLPRHTGKTDIMFTEHRPWTVQSRLENPLNTRRKKIYVEPVRHWTIFKGDRVEILTGKDKGKHGVVSQVIQERNWVIVEGLNTKLDETTDSEGNISSLFRKEQPLRVTDQVSLVDPSDLLPCKVEWRYTEKGERVRVSLRTGRIVPMTKLSQETYDYKTPATYRENKDKDTTADEISKITYEPALCTFEMDIMRKMNIKEDRIPAKVYWY